MGGNLKKHTWCQQPPPQTGPTPRFVELVRHLRSELRAAAQGLEEHKRASASNVSYHSPIMEVENFPKWYRKLVLEIHLLEFNILPEKWWLEDKPFLLGPGQFVKLWAGTL